MAQGKKTTIKDVAREANVSISVVSYVLNDSAEKSISPATRDRVIKAAERLQYIPNRAASGMRRKRSLAIGVVNYWELDVMVFADMLKGILDTASKSKYSVVLCHRDSRMDDDAYLNYYLNGTIDGIIFIAPYESMGLIDEVAHIDSMKRAGVPFVILNGSTRELDVTYINVDFRGSSYLATTYLIEQGHRDIAYVAPMGLSYSELSKRLQGYRDAMTEHGLTERCHDIGELPGCLAGMRAVVTNKSDTAHAIMEEALKLGISIPGELAIIAANTESYSPYLFPPLSTVRIPAEHMGELAVHAFLNQLEGKTEAEVLTPSCTLEIRKSC